MSEHRKPDLPLFERPAKSLSRARDPLPSHESADRLVASGELGSMMAGALERVKAAPGSTASELDPAGIGSRISKRLNDLVRSGFIRKGETRACRVTGRKVATWWPIA